MTAYSLGAFAPKRDVNGVPVLKGSRRHDQDAHIFSELRRWCQRLSARYDLIDFLRLWLLPQAYLTARSAGRRSEQQSVTWSVSEELEILERYYHQHEDECHLLINLQQATAAYALGNDPLPHSGPRASSKPFDEPQLFLRAFSPDSHTIYDDTLGFLSSGYSQCAPMSSFEHLFQSEHASEPRLRNHLEQRPEGTSWISMTNSAGWLMEKRYPPHVEDSDIRVAFINTEKLKRMQVLYQQSEMLLTQQRIPRYPKHQDGVRFTFPQHWLAYAWIPGQCIEHITSMRTLRKHYDACGPSVFERDTWILLRTLSPDW